MTRNDVLTDAIDKCIRELYSLAQPSVNYDDFIEENRIYLKRETDTYIPKPYEFYYLPKKVFEEVVNSYIDAYRFDEKQELLDIINILKEYCENPIVHKYIEGELREDGTRWPGYQGYDHSDNLEKELYQTLKEYFDDSETDPSAVAKELQNKFFEFLDMAGNFYNWNRDLNNFTANIYLGGTPSTNKEAVIENWKKYRNTDIEIDESKYEEE